MMKREWSICSLLLIFVEVECIESIAMKHLVLHLMLIDIDAYPNQDYDAKPFLLLIPRDFNYIIYLEKMIFLTSAVVKSRIEYSARDPSSRKIRIFVLSLLNIGSTLCTSFFPLTHSLIVLEFIFYLIELID